MHRNGCRSLAIHTCRDCFFGGSGLRAEALRLFSRERGIDRFAGDSTRMNLFGHTTALSSFAAGNHSREVDPCFAPKPANPSGRSDVLMFSVQGGADLPNPFTVHSSVGSYSACRASDPSSFRSERCFFPDVQRQFVKAISSLLDARRGL